MEKAVSFSVNGLWVNMLSNNGKDEAVKMIELFNQDCLEAMKGMRDKQFQLALVDPPYGIGISSNPFRQKHEVKKWDDNIPRDEYFRELFRVSQNQIIWGGNYFPLPPSQGFLIWDKIQPEKFSSSMCEMAWMSFQSPAKIFRKHVVTTETNKIHPTQKPVRLYQWLLLNYAKPGDRILDTHGGSCSLAIACDIMGYDCTTYEIDKEYFDAALARLRKHQSQGVLNL
jgi:site-specific DNA-methyltransferase (adenine-specific)